MASSTLQKTNVIATLINNDSITVRIKFVAHIIIYREAFSHFAEYVVDYKGGVKALTNDASFTVTTQGDYPAVDVTVTSLIGQSASVLITYV